MHLLPPFCTFRTTNLLKKSDSRFRHEQNGYDYWQYVRISCRCKTYCVILNCRTSQGLIVGTQRSGSALIAQSRFRGNLSSGALSGIPFGNGWNVFGGTFCPALLTDVFRLRGANQPERPLGLFYELHQPQRMGSCPELRSNLLHSCLQVVLAIFDSAS